MFKRNINLLAFFIIFSLLLSLALSPPPPALALSQGQYLEITVVPAVSALALAAGGYLLYKNRLSQPANAKGSLGYKGPGEFFVGGFLGSGLIANTSWKYRYRGQNITGNTMEIDPGITGGIKLGYFFDHCPYLGLEAEGSIGSQHQPKQRLSLSPAPYGLRRGDAESQSMLVWTMALHLVGRYGFLKDAEVPFGRLQPYVGIGPGLVVLYAEADSAKNFSLEVEAGLRYMFRKHFSAFLEYKLSQQWGVELESQQLFFRRSNFAFTASKATFDFTRHQFVLGLAYHF
jgi:opacity protein-like surface antigen